MASILSTGPTWTRGLIGCLIDRFLGWQFALPPETCNYKVQPLRIPIHEGLGHIELAADLYQPLIPGGAKPAGTILVQSPYGRAFPMTSVTARIYAARGYQVLFVSCRGYFGSGGEFDPCRDEIEDGQAIVKWMRKQQWYTGTFATLGPSYMGFNQWALLVDPPHDMVAAIVTVAPHNFQRVLWGTGALNMDFVPWAGLVGAQDEPYHFFKMILNPSRFRPLLNGLPLAQTIEAAYKEKTRWVHNWVKKSDPTDDYYTPMKLDEALERANIPILIISAWYDLFQDQSFEQYFRLRERGVNVAFTVGNWAHNNSAFNSEATLHSLNWLEEHLANRGKADRKAPMQYYVTGVGEWRHTAEYPPSSSSHTLYLHGGNRLGSETEFEGTGSSSFVFDPRDPTPSLGGNFLGQGAGKVDDTALAERSDVLVFTTEPLTEDMEMIARPIVELSHTTDIPYADLFVRVSEINQKGMSHNISEGYRRLCPEHQPETVQLPLSWCAHRFVKGTRIRLLIAGGSHPHYARNLGVKNLDNTVDEMKSVKHTIFHSPENASKLVFSCS